MPTYPGRASYGTSNSFQANPLFTGAGDLISGATAWWGFRAYTRASIGSNCVDIRRTSDGTVQTFVTVAGGGVDAAGITSFLSGGAGTISKLYDQTGNGNHLFQLSVTAQPSIQLNAIGSLPALSCSPGSVQGAFTLHIPPSSFNGGAVIPQPYTISTAYVSRSNSHGQILIGTSTVGNEGIFTDDGGQNNVMITAGGSKNHVTAADATWHAVQGVFNGASSDLNVDGVSNTGVNVGSFTFPTTGGSNNNIPLCGIFLDALIGEVGIWNIAFSPTNSSSMSQNQHAYWGF